MSETKSSLLADRRDDPPQGWERLAVSYLVSLLLLPVGCLIGVIASAIIDAAGTCADDPTGFCMTFLAGGIGAIVYWAGLFVVGYLTGLGTIWAFWILVVDLMAFEVVVLTNRFGWLAILAVAPAFAALVTLQRRAGESRRLSAREERRGLTSTARSTLGPAVAPLVVRILDWVIPALLLVQVLIAFIDLWIS